VYDLLGPQNIFLIFFTTWSAELSHKHQYINQLIHSGEGYLAYWDPALAVAQTKCIRNQDSNAVRDLANGVPKTEVHKNKLWEVTAGNNSMLCLVLIKRVCNN